ncbi:hypothetical protein [Paraburkholderia sp. J67]|uniref:hypothetical protein n=1 Tax=Paraburkholderia sp. J67 TaxID=2805435 RepID=UPI002ABD2D59|nr:hypothetical protein [Paraburkholderia sp. J67]
MPSNKPSGQSDPLRVKPWLAHTPQPDDPPPDQPMPPDVPPVGDPPPQPGEVPRSVDPRLYPAIRIAAHAQAREEWAHVARTAQRAGRAAWARWARWVGWACHRGFAASLLADIPGQRSCGDAASDPRGARRLSRA